MKKKMKRPLGVILVVCLAVSLLAGSAYAVNRYFEDAKGHWAEEAIQILTEKGVISGYPDGLAHPDEIITRGEFAALLARTMELPEPEESEVTLCFTDIAGHWSEQDIEALIIARIIQKDDFGTEFQPDQPITRMEMIRMLVRAIGKGEHDASCPCVTGFSDDGPLSEADKSSICTGKEYGIVDGYPDGEATRAEAFEMLVDTEKAKEQIKKEEPPKPTTPAKPTDKPSGGNSGGSSSGGGNSGGGSSYVPAPQFLFTLPKTAYTADEIEIKPESRSVSGVTWSALKNGLPATLSELTDGTLDKNGGKVKFTQTGSITLIAAAKNSRGVTVTHEQTISIYPVVMAAFTLPETTHTDKSVAVELSTENLGRNAVVWSLEKDGSAVDVEAALAGTLDSTGGTVLFKEKGSYTLTASITDELGKAVADVFDKAMAEAKKNGTEQNGITVVLRVDTGNKTGSSVTVNLPKFAQDTIIAKKIVNTIVVVDNPDIRIGMDLATVQEINKQAKSDVNIAATRTDSGKLTGDAKKAIGSRPVFDLKVNYGNGKAVSSFGAGSVSVTIPYTLGANENAGNVQAVYVDAKGKVHWLTNSVYDSVEKVLRFSTNHFSTYGIGYKQANTAFTDIAGHWAKEDIEFVVSRGLFSGTSETKFSPNAAMTRGMFVTVLGRLASADVSGYAKSSFSDVKSDAYYMGYIEWASKNNIVNGVGNGRFAPDQSITREQMAVIMSNYAKTIGYTLPKVHVENTFADNGKISAYAKEAVKQMQMAGVISGKNGNLFDPQGTATRAEVSAVLRRFVELAISNDTAQGWTMNDSGKWMYFKDGKPLTGKQDIDGGAYTFDQYGVTADVPKNLRYTTYIVQKGDSFWLIAHKLGCTMSELERLNNKSRFSIIYPGDVLRVPEK